MKHHPPLAGPILDQGSDLPGLSVSSGCGGAGSDGEGCVADRGVWVGVNGMGTRPEDARADGTGVAEKTGVAGNEDEGVAGNPGVACLLCERDGACDLGRGLDLRADVITGLPVSRYWRRSV